MKKQNLAMMLTALSLVMTANLRAQQDERPVVDESKVQQTKVENNNLPSLFIIGDSTVKAGPRIAGVGEMKGWGDVIGAYFDPQKINLVNRAIAGRSSKTFMLEGRWDKVLAEIKPGDFLIVQFGTNDSGQYDDPKTKYRPSLKGEGEETRELRRPGPTTQSAEIVETVHTFGWYMRKYASDAKAKGATVILVPMVPHKRWKDGKVPIETDSFIPWTRNAAEATGALFVPTSKLIAEGYEKLGEEKVEAFFADKGTHTSPEGAKFSAERIIAGFKGLEKNPLAPYFSKEADAIEPAK